jgi:hypothetical protein
VSRTSAQREQRWSNCQSQFRTRTRPTRATLSERRTASVSWVRENRTPSSTRAAGGHLDDLMARMAGCFRRWEPRASAKEYVRALMSDLPRKNCWTIAEHAGHATPGRMQHLLEAAKWDTMAAMAAVRAFVCEHLDDGDAVAVLDESGQEKEGTATVGVKRQYVGCAGWVSNAINVVYCSFAVKAGHAWWVPAHICLVNGPPIPDAVLRPRCPRRWPCRLSTRANRAALCPRAAIRLYCLLGQELSACFVGHQETRSSSSSSPRRARRCRYRWCRRRGRRR